MKTIILVVYLKFHTKGRVFLIVKPRDKPTHLLRIEALNRRLSAHHIDKGRVNNRARNLRAGYNGEISLDFTLSFLPEDQFLILHSLRIPDEHGCFQMDTLIISPQFVLIVEVKNIYGTIVFDDMGQMIRIKDDGTKEGFSNPIEQVNLQERRLRKWLQNNNFKAFPLEKVIIFSNPNTILQNITNNKMISNMVIHKEGLLKKIEEYLDGHKAPSLTSSQMKRLSGKLIAAHTPQDVDVMKRYGVLKHELLGGVICPDCSAIPMFYEFGNWKCGECGFVSKTAYLSALEDYRLLIGNTINNRQARDFLGLSSEYITKEQLQKADLQFTGNTSARKYLLS